MMNIEKKRKKGIRYKYEQEIIYLKCIIVCIILKRVMTKLQQTQTDTHTRANSGTHCYYQGKD